MDRNEAIGWLSELMKDAVKGIRTHEFEEALNMAIYDMGIIEELRHERDVALSMVNELMKTSAQPTQNSRVDSNNALDTISRQAAIDEAYEIIIDGQKFEVVQVETLMGLPSAQPEIIRCKDCEHWDTTWQNDFAPNYHYCPFIDGTRRADFYCADAEMRGE